MGIDSYRFGFSFHCIPEPDRTLRIAWCVITKLKFYHTHLQLVYRSKDESYADKYVSSSIE